MFMKTISLYTYSVIIFTLLLQGCNFSDSSENLGNDYYYRHEGGDLNHIYNKHPFNINKKTDNYRIVCEINGQRYNSVRDASSKTGESETTIRAKLQFK